MITYKDRTIPKAVRPNRMFLAQFQEAFEVTGNKEDRLTMDEIVAGLHEIYPDSAQARESALVGQSIRAMKFLGAHYSKWLGQWTGIKIKGG